MKQTFCGLTRFLLFVAFGALGIGWYRDVGAVADSQVALDPKRRIEGLTTHLPEEAALHPDPQSIPVAMRLITLPVHCWSTVSGFVRPGDRVDVVSVFRDKVTVVVGNVFVSTVHPQSRRFVCPVTLLMTHEQAHTLAEHLEPVWLAFHGNRPAKMGIVAEMRLKPLGADGRRGAVDVQHVLQLDAQADFESKRD